MGIIHSFLNSSATTFFLQSFISLFVIVNAIGNMPIFVPLLERFSDSEKAVMMRKATIIAACTLLFVTITGNAFFRLLGIEMFSFTIAGGILLMIVSIEMLLGQRTRTQSSVIEEQNSAEVDEITVIPLAIPLLTGPGALTTGVMLFANAGNLQNRIILLATIVIVFLISYLILARSRQLLALLGKTGTRVARRIMGLMLLSIAVKFIIKGIFDAVHLYAA
ncbi:MAG TPA: MarC family protein [Syntrophorhabdaceae bacterium]|nr:MarC family protein [Syntrophorhabdaceae bacterium]